MKSPFMRRHPGADRFEDGGRCLDGFQKCRDRRAEIAVAHRGTAPLGASGRPPGKEQLGIDDMVKRPAAGPVQITGADRPVALDCGTEHIEHQRGCP